MGGVRIAVGYHHWGMVQAKFCSSLLRAVVYEGRRVSDIIDMPSPYVAEARNKIVWAFLDKTKANYLLMVDADMEFPEDAISAMAWLASSYGLPILGANYSLGDFGNSLFAARPNTHLVAPVLKVEPNKIYRNLGGAATGFLLLKRDAMEKFRGEGGFEAPWHWFDHDRESTTGSFETGVPEFLSGGFTKMGEDMSFSQRAIRLGLEVAGTTHVPLIHHKTKPTVPFDQVGQFDQRVYTQANPWIEVLQKRKAENENRPEVSGLVGGGSGVCSPLSGTSDCGPTGSGGQAGLESAPDSERDLSGSVHED